MALKIPVIITVNQVPTLSETYSNAEGKTVSTPGPANPASARPVRARGGNASRRRDDRVLYLASWRNLV